MILQDLWWIDYLIPALLLLIALPLSVWAIIIDIRKKKQSKHDQLRAKYYKKHLVRHVRKSRME